MAYDLEEQEQLDEFKAWWKKNGQKTIALGLLLLLAYAAYNGWHYFQRKQAVEASTIYQELLVSDTKDTKTISEKSTHLIESYASTPYAARAAVYVAKLNYQNNDIKNAKAKLEWAMNNAKETAVAALAGLQLANILVEEKSYDAALKILDAKHDSGFDGLYWDLKGDILVALGKKSEAKSAYQRALTKLDAQGKYHLITEQKLESLG
jgi:predicted negative regulator of RcsB-dependent stress response